MKAASNPEAQKPQMEEGVQVVNVTVGPSSCDPERIALQEGVPARIVFTRTGLGRCTEQVQIPDFDISKTNLPQGEPVAVEFTPKETGDFTFACGMDMVKGTILVQEPAPAAA